MCIAIRGATRLQALRAECQQVEHQREYANPHAHEEDRLRNLLHDHGHRHEHGHDHDHDHDHDHPPLLTPDYSRQIALREVGPAGQARLLAASVLVVGAGGLGVPVLQYLAGAGVGRLGIVDADRLEPSNLHRQTWYALADCGREKSTLAAERVNALNPEVHVQAHALRLDAGNADRLAEGYDLILDCSDNFTTKFLLNDLALRTRKPVLFASVYQYEGQLQLVRGDDASACLRCVWPTATRDGIVGNCAEAGVLGPVPGVFGSLQALEALKLLLGIPGLEPGDMLVFDLLTLGTQRLKASRAADCDAHRRVGLALPTPLPQELEVQFESLADAQAAGFLFVDVRDARERAEDPLPAPALNLPMSKLLTDATMLDSGGRYLLICATGKRSAAAADLLRSQGFNDCRSLRGGIKGLKASA
jgi:adenylyltransferase/sulfurtransferase